MTPATKTEWRKLRDLAKRPRDIRKLFADNPRRAKQWALEGGGLLLDSAKAQADDNALAALNQLARAAQVCEKLNAQAQGEKINFTENRPALHSALRARPAPADADPPPPPSDADSHPSLPSRPSDSAPPPPPRLRSRTRPRRPIRRGPPQWKNHRAKRAAVRQNPPHRNRRVAPRTRTPARRPLPPHPSPPPPPLPSQNDRPEIRFVANADPAALADALSGIRPDETLVVAVSKSFSTGETLENARAAKAWLRDGAGPAAAQNHFAAVTANPAAARAFGVSADRVFIMSDWVGGRYSLWSAASLSAVAAVGEKSFREFLQGGGEMDSHVLAAPPEKNLAVRMALLGVWHCNFLGAQTHCVVAYQHRLRGFARYLQQLVMESNGKRVQADGKIVAVDSGEILWGGEGTNDQHSYFQLLAQGTRTVPVDFILARSPESEADAEAHRRLLAHALGWSRALMTGRSFESARTEALARGMSPREARQLAAHQECPGNRPSNTILIPKLTARTLGALTALYEHKVAAQSFIWGVNAFDQWGVESGKNLTREILDAMRDGNCSDLDPSTRMLLSRIQPD